jgi:FAD/FMN-containing dehydrogenase
VFQVKSGGHATNPGFSSTKGIHIYTEKFSQVTYDVASGTAVIGSGLVWDTVYQQLQEHNVSVLGGRVTGVGVRGSPGRCDPNPVA